jgi:hypothetical protein
MVPCMHAHGYGCLASGMQARIDVRCVQSTLSAVHTLLYTATMQCEYCYASCHVLLVVGSSEYCNQCVIGVTVSATAGSTACLVLPHCSTVTMHSAVRCPVERDTCSHGCTAWIMTDSHAPNVSVQPESIGGRLFHEG